MDEDLLSPQLGRLIDEAKAAARKAGPDIPRAEGVALLTAAGTVHTGITGTDHGPLSKSPAAMALESARRAGEGEILAAAVAVPSDPAETVLPSSASELSLREVDAELPLVFKKRGRWVMLPLSRLDPSE